MARKSIQPAKKRQATSRNYHHGNLREALLKAALVLIREKGPQALSLREVARRAGVSQAAPYRHFDSKEALLAAVAEEGFRALTEEMAGATAACKADPARVLEELGVAYVRFAATHPSHFHVMFGPDLSSGGRYPGLESAGKESFQYLLDGVVDLQKAGIAPQAPPLELALPAWGLVQGLSSLLVAGRLPGAGTPNVFSPDAEHLIRAAARRLISGVSGGGVPSS